jgi:hypothetical protein
VRAHVLVVSALLVAAPALAADKPGQQPRAHRHGAAQLQVSLEGGALQVAFEGPADNILGFEHAPRTEAQKSAVTRAEQKLAQPGELFALPAAAECQPQPARVELRLPPPGSRETHAEVEIEWRWTCANPAALAYIDVGLFKAFPRLKQLRAQVVTGQGQRTTVLKPGTARLKLGS